MKKFLLLGIISLCLTGLMVTAEETSSDEAVVVPSSDGIGAVVTKNVDSKSFDKEYKKERKSRKQLVKNISSIENIKEKKRIKERDLEFYNSRLQIQKRKLDELQEKKGENQ